jgi:hypothetical protein
VGKDWLEMTGSASDSVGRTSDPGVLISLAPAGRKDTDATQYSDHKMTVCTLKTYYLLNTGIVDTLR